MLATSMPTPPSLITTAQFSPLHNDLGDRLIFAVAKLHKLHDLAVVTTDDQFEKYGVTLVRLSADMGGSSG